MEHKHNMHRRTCVLRRASRSVRANARLRAPRVYAWCECTCVGVRGVSCACGSLFDWRPRQRRRSGLAVQAQGPQSIRRTGPTFLRVSPRPPSTGRDPRGFRDSAARCSRASTETVPLRNRNFCGRKQNANDLAEQTTPADLLTQGKQKRRPLDGRARS